MNWIYNVTIILDKKHPYWCNKKYERKNNFSITNDMMVLKCGEITSLEEKIGDFDKKKYTFFKKSLIEFY